MIVQCCIKDDSRSIAYVVQPRYANHPKVLHSKDVVLSVRRKGVLKHQVSARKLNASEPSEDMSKAHLVVKSIGSMSPIRRL